MAEATVPTNTPASQPTPDAAADGRTFANLIEARTALWRGVNELESALYEVRATCRPCTP
jgi:hypothetical protein